jgi:hypothetical protein
MVVVVVVVRLDMHDDCNGKKNNEISFENTSEGNIDR